MKKRRIVLKFIFSFIFVCRLFAAEEISLIDSAKTHGMTFYWDSLSETGMLEKDGHQFSFRKEEIIAVLDNSKIIMVDPPVIKNNKIYVSPGFIKEAQDFFLRTQNDSAFKVGAIVIDAGHGGKDPGALKTYKIGGKNVTIREKDINLKVALMLYERLKTAYPDKKIVLTRSTDKFLSLSERTDIANGIKVDKDDAILFISIHVNSSLNKTSSGYEVWYLSPGYRRNVLDKSVAEGDNSLYTILNGLTEEEYTTESIMIAKFIMDGLQSQIGSESKSRGIKAEEWFVVKNALMPSVLIELGFVSNEAEAKKLNDDKYLKKATLGIYNGITAYITHFERSRGFTVANEN